MMMKTLSLLLLLVVVAKSNVSVNININNQVFNVGNELVIDWEITSDSGLGQTIYKFNTPLEGEWNSNLFNIVNNVDSSRAEYQGKVLRRVEPQLHDFEFIPTIKSRTGQMALNEGYKFYSAGEHTVSMKFLVRTISGETYMVESNEVTFTVEKPDVRIPFEINEEDDRAISYYYCTLNQKSVTQTAISNTIYATGTINTYMTGSCGTSYNTWFGTYSYNRWNTVQLNFLNVNGLISSTSFNIDCSCNEPGVYAYVYPTDKTHRVYLCPVFWTSPPGPFAWTSQPGTLTHEMSHFNDVAGTDDVTYGYGPSKSLAQSSPNTAITNADNYAYFQDSNPLSSIC